MPNRLSDETSPYLLQHADNPVDWHAWDDTALDLARSEEKPILLSVGYSACHWCHVMAHECFEDEATAALMNRLFINIKVDREERPDIDKIYQQAHQLVSQNPGGWPLTVFLTPEEQLPIFSGTYFPREMFKQVLERVSSFYGVRLRRASRRAELGRQRFDAVDRRATGRAATDVGDRPVGRTTLGQEPGQVGLRLVDREYSPMRVEARVEEFLPVNNLGGGSAQNDRFVYIERRGQRSEQ